MGADDVAVLFGVFGESRFQRRMNRALAAIHHDGGIEHLAGLVEDDVVVFVEGKGTDPVWTEITLDIVPAER